MIWPLLLATLSAAELPHVEQVAPGVTAVGFADKYKSSNAGWVEFPDRTVLVDSGPEPYTAELIRRSKANAMVTTGGNATSALPALAGDNRVVRIEYAGGRRAIWLPAQRVLFAGDLITNGPRAEVTAHDTSEWLAALERLKKLDPAVVVPGRGSWGQGATLIDRQIRFLGELRRQVAYAITMGRSLEAIQKDLLLPASYYTWMPYDNPRPDDIRHLYRELTSPPIRKLSTARDNALVLIGDRFHEPEHLEEGLRPALEAANVEAHFTVDTAQLNAVNLAKVKLLVILRDGMLWPDGPDKPYKIWMTPEQEKAVVDFVENGGGFLNLHNSMGLYPENGPYLKLVGGRYIGHGPLERFRVEVVDRDHPVTQGLSDWFAADEQHTPPLDAKRAKLLLRNRSDEGKTAAAGWAYEPGKGRLCHLASGHTRDALGHPMYQRALVNALRWCLRK